MVYVKDIQRLSLVRNGTKCKHSTIHTTLNRYIHLNLEKVFVLIEI